MEKFVFKLRAGMWNLWKNRKWEGIPKQDPCAKIWNPRWEDAEPLRMIRIIAKRWHMFELIYGGEAVDTWVMKGFYS